MNVHLGEFHGVVGVAVGVSCVSILNQQGVEHLIPVKPKFNRKNAEFEQIQVTGEFGDFTGAKGGERLQGLEPEDIIGIDVLVNFVDDDFHTRVLSMKSASGTCLTWELYCEGEPA